MKTVLWSMLALMACSMNAEGKNVMTPTFMFGFAASFNDSTVYFTDIQEVDSAWLTEKTKFLVGRDNYSYQLRDYLSTIGKPNRTCMVSFAVNRKDAEKKFAKLMAKYQPRKNSLAIFDIHHLSTDDFKFKAIKPWEETTGETTKPEKKKNRKAKAPRNGQMPPQGGMGSGGQGMPGGGQPPMM